MNDNKIKLSILIPTRNRAAYLQSCIESALRVNGEIEIIVSENHGTDNSWEICQKYNNSKITMIRPDKPLPMHENWNFLINRAQGEWIIFLGDDDAILSHACEYINNISEKYPTIEAIVSPRAYYFWPQNDSLKSRYYAPFSNTEMLCNSKADLDLALNGQIDYIYLPQIYSGGFQRKSLVKRIIKANNGKYFNSLQPDAYSALMALLFTARYLRVGVPLSVVGTSPASSNGHLELAKDRDRDFWDLLSEESPVFHPIYPKRYANSFGTFPLRFYETYISASNITNYSEDNLDRLNKIFLSSVIDLLRLNRLEDAQLLASHLNFDLPDHEKIMTHLNNFPKITPDPITNSIYYGNLNEDSSDSSLLHAIKLWEEAYRLHHKKPQ
jgi:glycosyltransferase involved in cell wall biosynthesis